MRQESFDFYTKDRIRATVLRYWTLDKNIRDTHKPELRHYGVMMQEIIMDNVHDVLPEQSRVFYETHTAEMKRKYDYAGKGLKRPDR